MEGLGFEVLNFRYQELPAILYLLASIMSLVQIPASDDLTIVMPLYHLLLEVS